MHQPLPYLPPVHSHGVCGTQGPRVQHQLYNSVYRNRFILLYEINMPNVFCAIL